MDFWIFDIPLIYGIGWAILIIGLFLSLFMGEFLWGLGAIITIIATICVSQAEWKSDIIYREGERQGIDIVDASTLTSTEVTYRNDAGLICHSDVILNAALQRVTFVPTNDCREVFAE